jgi:hypothetical protein
MPIPAWLGVGAPPRPRMGRVSRQLSTRAASGQEAPPSSTNILKVRSMGAGALQRPRHQGALRRGRVGRIIPLKGPIIAMLPSLSVERNPGGVSRLPTLTFGSRP